MPHYNLNNSIYWFDSEEEAAEYQPTALLITDAEADLIRTEAQAKAKAEYEASLTYAQKRQAAYPSIQDQLDTIFHGGLDAWKAEIQAVKDAIPKEQV